VAGTGNDTRPNRVLNPVRQAERFDPDGVYVRRYLPELESVQGKAIFRSWLMEDFERLDYRGRSSITTVPRRPSERGANERGCYL
jgi:deoxyribodipyrimidine photo-lyase